MNYFRSAILIIFCFSIISCSEQKKKESPVIQKKDQTKKEKDSLNRIPVLNFATFHMGFTTDANKTEFDQHNRKNQEKVHEVAKELSDFAPSVILVEVPPERNEELQQKYQQYLENADIQFESPSEIELLAFELGRLSDTKRIYGIDHKMNYDYRIGSKISNEIDPEMHDSFYADVYSYFPEAHIKEDISLKQKLRDYNTDARLDFLITANADMLTHAGTEQGFEGADEAAKYYQRNLRMYSNMNRIDLDKNDRVFILMGASHTAFFRDFLSRSPKYRMVDTFKYLD